MLFYNDYDIAQAVQRFALHPVLNKAARMLAAVAHDADCNSDGWHSWPKPARACKALMTLLEAGRNNAVVSDADYRKALAPIKAFYTRMRGLRNYSTGKGYPAMPELSGG